jgi:hypothetical protein
LVAEREGGVFSVRDEVTDGEDMPWKRISCRIDGLASAALS